MSFIVPMKLPKSCANCLFSVLRYQHPFWSKGGPGKVGTKGYYCQCDKERRLIEMCIEDNTTKAEWCPLIEVKE